MQKAKFVIDTENNEVELVSPNGKTAGFLQPISDTYPQIVSEIGLLLEWAAMDVNVFIHKDKWWTIEMEIDGKPQILFRSITYGRKASAQAGMASAISYMKEPVEIRVK